MNIIAKILLSSALVVSAGIALANTPVNQAAIAQAQATVKTVQQALTAKDDAQVELRGHVVKALGDEKYEFRDNTGTIVVEIDDELWQGRPIAANATVTLSGKVDVDYKPTKRVEIDVKSIGF